MNAYKLAQTGYSSQAHPVRTARGTEYEVFGRITRRILEAIKKGKPGFNDLVAALHDNRQIWTILALDVGCEGNGLPDEIRARILYLNEFTQLHTSKVLSGEADPNILVEINTAIMRGLRGHKGAA